MIIAGTDIRRGLFGRKRVLMIKLFGEYIPEPVLRYAEGIAKITGQPLEEVLKSEPVQKFKRRFYDGAI